MTRGRCSFKVGEFWDLVQCTCTWHTLRIWIFYYQYLISQVDRLMDTDSLLSVFFPVMQFIFFFKKYLFIFRGRGREGDWEGEKHRCVREPSICCLSNQGPGLQPIELVTFWMIPNPLSHTSQGFSFFFFWSELFKVSKVSCVQMSKS